MLRCLERVLLASALFSHRRTSSENRTQVISAVLNVTSRFWEVSLTFCFFQVDLSGPAIRFAAVDLREKSFDVLNRRIALPVSYLSSEYLVSTDDFARALPFDSLLADRV